MKKIIAVLAILSLTVLNLNSQNITATLVGSSTVCAGSTVQVNFTATTTSTYYYARAWSVGSSTWISSFNTLTANQSGVSGSLTMTVPTSGAVRIYLTFSSSNAGPGGITSYVTLPLVINTTPTITASNGTVCSGQSFSIVPSGNTFNVLPSITSTYVVTGSNVSCPASTIAVVVLVNSAPTIVVNSAAICNGKSYTIIPTGANTYSISGGSFIVSPTINTVYNITGTSSAGCASTNTAAITISVNPNPTISVNSGSICVGKQFTLSPLHNGVSVSYPSGSAIVSPITNSLYAIIAMSAAGCTTSAISSITVHALPVLSVNSGSICMGNTFVINPTGAVSYTVSGGNFTVSPSSITSYSVAGTSSLGCISNSVSSTVSVSALPIISVNSGSICAGKAFTITATGAASYAVSGSTMVVSPSTTSNYTVTGTSSVGCISSNTVVATVTVNQLPTVSVNSGTICAGKVFTINPTGASSYTVAGGSLTVSPSSNSTYTVIGSSSVGCVNTNPVTASVTVNAIPVISVSSTTNTLCQGSTATISAVGASSFVWAGNGNGSQIIVSPNVTTIYTVTGTDVNGCENTVNFTQTVVVCNTNTTGIADNSMNISSRIYPVPANNDLTIELGNVNDNIAVTITIYSLEGKIVMSNIQNLYNSTAKVELSTVQNGVYMLEVKSDSFRLVKNIIVAK